jgi:preprotein translocase subunit SecB
MKASPLQLVSSAFIKIHIEAEPTYAEHLEDGTPFSLFSEAGLKSSVEVGFPEDDSSQGFVRLKVEMLGTAEVPSPYKLDLDVLGSFTVAKNSSEKLLEVNGPAVLYGSVREVVMQLTSRGPYPQLVLPTVTFIPPEIQTDETGKRTETV